MRGLCYLVSTICCFYAINLLFLKKYHIFGKQNTIINLFYFMNKHNLYLSTLAALFMGCSVPKGEYPTLDDYPVPTTPICEMQYQAKATTFQLWSPNADAVLLRIYDEGEGGSPVGQYRMKRQKDGLWITNVKENLLGKFYTFSIEEGGKTYAETPGIFAKAVGVNGHRAAVIDLSSTNPEGWTEDKSPALESVADAVIYEMHWRDMTVHQTSGMKNKGKFLSLTEAGTTVNAKAGAPSTGIDHLKELGVTHIHILPSYDYGSVDENRLNTDQYNWGYDPINYNVPDGSYSTNPYDPSVRINEFKQMVMACHQAGIRVVLDVVYNHTMDVENSNFTLTAPGYFYRTREDGTLGNASGCGNETASNRPMMRKFMVESVLYWMKEYHLDGFRFDLMGIHDIETMSQIRDALQKVDPQVLIYGEGWAAEGPQYPEDKLAMKANMQSLPGVAAFSDDLRDALRGPFSDDHASAFLAALPDNEQSIRFGIVGAIDHPEVDVTKVNYSKSAWTTQPQQHISYVSCHDDMCLVDRLKTSIPNGPLAKLHMLAETAVLTSQGIPFVFCGEEVLRDKKGVHNSYNSPDSINAISWSLKVKNKEVFDYYCSLIAMRKAHKAFHMGDASLVKENLHFLDTPSCVVAFTINGAAVGDSWKNIIVLLNSNAKPQSVAIPSGEYSVVCCDGKIDVNGLGKIRGQKVSVPAQSAMIIVQ